MTAGVSAARATAWAVGAVCCFSAGAAVAQDFTPSPGGVPVPPAGAVLGSGPPQFGNALPAPGSGYESGGLREQIANALGFQLAGDPNAPAIIYTAGVDLTEEYTYGSGGGGSSNTGAALTRVSPILGVELNTTRARGNLIYAPTANFYESGNQRNRVEQNLRADTTITFVPEEVFLKLKGFASEQSLLGGQGPTGTTQLNTNNAVQNYSFSANPYVLHRFGTFGSTELGASVSETAQLANNGQVTVSSPGLPPQTFANQNTTAYNLYGAFASGEDFGRWLAYPYFSATEYTGTGVFQGAHRRKIAFEGGYALFRNLDLLGGVGYENIAYNSNPPVRVSDAIWNAGGRLTPNPDSSITVLYQHSDGFTGPYVNANYALSARTRFFANYSISLSSDQEQLLNTLINSSFDALGDSTDLKTGQPILLSDNFFGISTAVYKLRQGSIGGAMLDDRNTFVANFRYQSRNAVGTPPINSSVASAGTVQSSTGEYGSLHWQRELQPDLSAALYGQVGELTSDVGTARQKSHVVVLAANLSWVVTTGLTAGVQASHTETFYVSPTHTTQSSGLVAVSLRKTF